MLVSSHKSQQKKKHLLKCSEETVGKGVRVLVLKQDSCTCEGERLGTFAPAGNPRRLLSSFCGNENWEEKTFLPAKNIFCNVWPGCDQCAINLWRVFLPERRDRSQPTGSTSRASCLSRPSSCPHPDEEHPPPPSSSVQRRACRWGGSSSRCSAPPSGCPPCERTWLPRRCTAATWR